MNNTTDLNTPVRQTAMNGLAVAGFIALVIFGMWLAVYSTRFVPNVIGRMSTAAVYVGSTLTPAIDRIGMATVYLGSVFTPTRPTLSVVSTPAVSTTTSPNEADSITSTPSSPTVPKQITPTAGEKTSNVYQINSTPASPTLSGLPDFIVSINAIGYLATTSAESFVASSTVPAGLRPAVTFTIKNIGMNTASAWRFSASIPTQTAFIYQSDPQQSLNPGDSIDYTLGFDQANKGTDQIISITANFNRAVTESDTDNNSASTKITILGS